MANAIYPKYKEAAMGGGPNVDLLTSTVKVALIDTANYTYSAAHEFLDDVTNGTDPRVGTDQTLGTKTVTNGAFDSADPTWSSLTGDSVEALIFYVDTGSAATSRLIAYIDTGQTNLPFTPNGGNVTINVNASGWFAL